VRATPPAGPVAQGLPHGAAALGGDDDDHVRDAGRGHGLQDVKQDARVGHRYELLGAGVGEGPETRAPDRRRG